MTDDVTGYRRQRAELLIARPRPYACGGQARDDLRALRAETLSALDDADERLRQALSDRQAAITRAKAIDTAIRGTRLFINPDGSVSYLGAHRRHKADEWDDPLGGEVDADLEVIDTDELRRRLVDLLHALDEPVSGRDLRRLLTASGVRPSGATSKAIGNALRQPISRGVVERVGRGHYRARPSSPDGRTKVSSSVSSASP